MPAADMIILHVADVRRSAAFWGDLLATPILEISDGFAMLALNPSTRLGLWNRAGVRPPATAQGGGGEILLHCADDAAVDAAHADCLARGIAVVQAPVTLEFGRTFAAVDPDGHRIRVLRPSDD